MSEAQTGEGLTPDERQAVDHLMRRVARSAPAIEEALDTLDHLSESGNLAALNGILKDFDENFNAITRPDMMTMIANMMMLMGFLGQISYEPFFTLAMKVPPAVNQAYPEFKKRKSGLGMRETLQLMRSPEVAGALQMMHAVLQSVREEDAP
jgi:uncharacterized protein YjgD (DUF1641 family)